MSPLTPAEFGSRCLADAELGLAVRHWTGGVRFEVRDQSRDPSEAVVYGFTVEDGLLSAEVPVAGPQVIVVAGPLDTWTPLLEAVPPPFAQIAVLVSMGEVGLQRSPTDPLLWWQYLPAVERAAELLRGTPRNGAPGQISREQHIGREAASHHDSPTGRYVHVDLDGLDHRLYYEEAGQGIPLLLQHTAGAHGTQWRHLFEMPEITANFRLIAYDLPFHGKSIPPVEKRWWEEQYLLHGSFLRQVPVALAAALELDRPVFMGCSVGGLLALDLALHHPELFRAVISLEGALHIGGEWQRLLGMWHPQVSSHSKARMMEGLCGPMSPEPYVKEVSQVYAAGWPPAFVGDLYYYMVDYDLRDRAGEIDTSRVGVHIMNGEYDYSGTVTGGREAHEAIPGSTHTEMAGVGHFPMQENPEVFRNHLLPVLGQVRSAVEEG